MQATMLALCLFAVTITQTIAEEPGTASVNLLPSNGQHRGIVLKSQTVDTIISEKQGAMWADTKVWLKLQNPASKPITVSVTLPGPQLAPLPLPADLTVLVGKAPLQLRPATGSNSGQSVKATAAIGIPARKSVDVRIAYHQALSETNGLVTYNYLLGEASQWAGTPESLRLTVKVESPVSMSSLLSASPPVHRSDGQAMTWDWETDWGKLGPNVILAFMAPTWFAEFAAAQSAAAGKDAGASEHILLSQYYQRLASLPVSLAGASSGFHSRYYPATIAELQAALDSKGSARQKAQAHSLLAGLYLQQAGQAEAADKVRYLQAAAAEIELALGGSLPEPDLVDLAGRVLGQLSDIASVAGQDATARGYLDQLEGIRAFSPQQATHTQSTNQKLDEATHALEQGKTEVARELIAPLLETEAVAEPGVSAPIVSHTSLTVTTTPQYRQIVVHLGVDQDQQRAADLAAVTEKALRRQGAVETIAAANAVTLTLPGAPGPAMFSVQKNVAAALPSVPELALLRSALANASGYTETHSSLLQSTYQYTEMVDLAPAVREWEEAAVRLESATRTPTQGLPPAEDKELKRIQLSLEESDAAAWRRFGANSRVDYRFESVGADTDYQWQLHPGESKRMVVRLASWNQDSIQWALTGLGAALLAVAALLWRLV